MRADRDPNRDRETEMEAQLRERTAEAGRPVPAAGDRMAADQPVARTGQPMAQFAEVPVQRGGFGDGWWADGWHTSADAPDAADTHPQPHDEAPAARGVLLRHWWTGLAAVAVLAVSGAIGFVIGRWGWRTGALAPATQADGLVAQVQMQGAGGDQEQAGRAPGIADAVGGSDAGLAWQDGAGQIVVDVHGDVRHPGVYTLPFGARVRDAIAAAGGYRHREDADEVNAAAPLDDGAEVVVPRHRAGADSGAAAAAAGDGVAAGDGAASGAGAAEAMAAGDGATDTSATAAGAVAPQAADGGADGTYGVAAGNAKIDLNTATEATLETLPGIGPARAAAIVTYRTQHGPFADLQDLRQVPGIGPVTWAKVAPYLYVGGR